jgi:hypothetical protein
MLHTPPVLRLPRAALARRDVVERSLRGADPVLFHAFALKGDELAFARALAERGNFWIWRVDQRAFGGDFVVVDVSSPSPSRRRPLVLDLKRGARVRVGRAGIQMRRAEHALAAIAAQGVIDRASDASYLTGDARALLVLVTRGGLRGARGGSFGVQAAM